jgi:hypothetical protein
MHFCKRYEINQKLEKEKEKEKDKEKEERPRGTIPAQPQIEPTAQDPAFLNRYVGHSSLSLTPGPTCHQLSRAGDPRPSTALFLAIDLAPLAKNPSPFPKPGRL